MTREANRRKADARRKGTILIVTMWIIFAMAGLVLVLAQSMQVEAVCSANECALLQADAVEQGAIQYVLEHVDAAGGQLPKASDMPCEAVPVGQGGFWILNSNPGGNALTYSWGLVDEASKLNLNTASLAMLSKLPNMTTEMAACIVDWRDSNETTTSGGAESDYYSLLPDPYQCKNAPLETVEELLLIKNMTPDILYGEDANRNGVLDPNENDGDRSDPPDNGDGALDRGLYPFVTVYSSEPNPNRRSGGGAYVKGHINVGTAPREVLTCLPGLDSNDVAALLTARADASTDLTKTAWVSKVLTSQKYRAIAGLITAKSYQFSADIVSVSGNGRAFRRCHIVVEARKSPAKVIYRQDWTHLGWPLAPEILDQLKAGLGVANLPRQSISQEKP